MNVDDAIARSIAYDSAVVLPWTPELESELRARPDFEYASRSRLTSPETLDVYGRSAWWLVLERAPTLDLKPAPATKLVKRMRWAILRDDGGRSTARLYTAAQARRFVRLAKHFKIDAYASRFGAVWVAVTSSDPRQGVLDPPARRVP